MMATRLRRSGFTILELLISTALLTTLLVTTWACYATASRSMNRVMGRFDVFLKVIHFRRGFINSVQGASPYPQVANTKADFKGESRKLAFTTLSTPFPLPTSPPVPISPIAWVEFGTTPGGKHTVSAHPYYFLSSDLSKDKADRIVLEDVKKWEFGYYDGSSWSTAWDYSLKRKLPRQVRVKYTLTGERREVEDVITVSIAQEAEPQRSQGTNLFQSGQAGVGGPGNQPVPNPSGAPPPA
ncbi:MAG: hypothetical protein HY814_06065, partial [Candidatus Riflebacteria bacterium]|nr:hypothetical protein [Candidatus Riflebacteria bacterium]